MVSPIAVAGQNGDCIDGRWRLVFIVILLNCFRRRCRCGNIKDSRLAVLAGDKEVFALTGIGRIDGKEAES